MPAHTQQCVCCLYVYLWSGDLVSQRFTVLSLKNRKYQRLVFTYVARKHVSHTWGRDAVQSHCALVDCWIQHPFFSFWVAMLFIHAIHVLCTLLMKGRPFSSPLYIEWNRNRGRTSVVQGFVWERTGMLQIKLYLPSLPLHQWPSTPPSSPLSLCNLLNFSSAAFVFRSSYSHFP